MRSETFFEILGDMDESYVEGAMQMWKSQEEAAGECAKEVKKTMGKYKKTAEENEAGKKFGWRSRTLWGTAAACLALTAVCLSLRGGFVPWNSGWALSEASQGVRVKTIKRIPNERSSACLIHLTEEELFSHFDTAIFAGTVTGIENIVIDFNGDKNYRAVVKIQVEKVYRGPLEVQETVSVLAPCCIGGSVWSEDMDTLSMLSEGMRGIFMPIIYDENSVRQQNGAVLALKDVADYGFADGVRYAFLDAEEGLVFAKWAYESIKDAGSLEEVEAYIMKMIGGGDGGL